MTRSAKKPATVAPAQPADYPIERNIPITSGHGGRKRKYPLKEMKPGDSFLVPNDELQRNVRKSVANCAVYYGFRIVSRKTEDGIRFWRKP